MRWFTFGKMCIEHKVVFWSSCLLACWVCVPIGLVKLPLNNSLAGFNWPPRRSWSGTAPGLEFYSELFFAASQPAS
jgi:hypothetical protein